MSRRIDVGAPLTDMRIEFREKTCPHDVATFLVPVNCLAYLIGKPRPPGNSRCKGVRQIYVSFMGKNLLDLPERPFVGTPRRGKCFKKQDGAQQQDLFDAHPVLLKHLRLRGEYVRITLNKSRPSSKKQTYR